jgi:mitogen-activated protein kinase kinase kinase
MEAEEVDRLFRRSVVNQTCSIQWQQGELLGEGAYGKVFAGLNQTTGELMAVKQHKLPAQELVGTDPHLARQAEQELATLEHEIEVLKKLRHQHIVGYLSAERVNATEIYVFLEYVPGGSISSMLQVRHPPRAVCLSVRAWGEPAWCCWGLGWQLG